MIRINLLGNTERQAKKKVFAFDMAQRVTAACVLLVALTAGGLGYWYYVLWQGSIQVDAEIAAAQQEQAQLQSVIREVSQFDQRRTQLQQRVGLIEELRGGQSVPVQLLDQISRSIPDMLWLTDFEQKGASVTIQGQATTLISLSDFVGNLGNSSLLTKPIEIVNSQVETAAPSGTTGPAVDLIKFTVKAQLATAAPAAVPASAVRPGMPAPAAVGGAK